MTSDQKEWIVKAFKIDPKELDGCEIILFENDEESYSGLSWIIYRKDGKLYENTGSHCSCFYFEGQWDPYEVTEQALRFRLKGKEEEYAELFGNI